MSGLQDTLSKICCCFDIEFGGFLIGLTRLVLHLARVMIAIILLWGGIVEGVETTTVAAAAGAAGGGAVTEPASGSASGSAPASTAKPAGFGATYDSERKLTKYQMETMSEMLTTLAICWVAYYSVYFLITFVYLIGLKMSKWVLIIPMFLMSAADIVAPAFLPFPGNFGILFAYMMNDPYEKPAITLIIFWEASNAVFGLYVFSVVWGSLLAIKYKMVTPRSSFAPKSAPAPISPPKI